MSFGSGRIAFVLLAAGCANLTPVGTVTTETFDASPSPITRTANLEHHSFRSALLNRDVTYYVYVPRAYATNRDVTYPVVYWLHGSGGYPPGVLQMLASRFDTAMTERKMPPALIVFPVGFEGTLWANAADGKMPVEDMITNEMVPQVDATFRTRPEPGGRLLEGASMGGYGAARLGFLHPDIFGAISMINPGPMQLVMDIENAPIVGRAGARETLDKVFGGDVALFKRQSPWNLAAGFAKKGCQETPIRLVLGKTDPITPTNLAFAGRLRDLKIAHDIMFVSDAGHDPRAMFANLGESYWDFFGKAFEAKPARGRRCR